MTILEYVGPPGQTSAVFGDLRPGQRVPCRDADLARVLIEHNATHWRAYVTPATKED